MTVQPDHGHLQHNVNKDIHVDEFMTYPRALNQCCFNLWHSTPSQHLADSLLKACSSSLATSHWADASSSCVAMLPTEMFRLDGCDLDMTPNTTAIEAGKLQTCQQQYMHRRQCTRLTKHLQMRRQARLTKQASQAKQSDIMQQRAVRAYPLTPIFCTRLPETCRESC